MRTIFAVLTLFVSLAACEAPPAAATSRPDPGQPTGWKAVLIAGGNQEPAFDNAVDAMAGKLEEYDVPASAITVLKATASQARAATLTNIREAFATLRPSAGEGCFVFITSHGAPRRGLVLERDQRYLAPKELGGLLDGACAGHPTVVIASGCYSGSFAEGNAMPAANRVILTAARNDRPSFGCNAKLRYTVFDRCILENLERGEAWHAVMDRTRRCVAASEREMGVDRPSGPQLSIGTGAGKLLAFAPR